MSSSTEKFTDSKQLRKAILLYYASEKSRQNIIKRFGTIENWDVSQITDMSMLFYKLPNFNEDISKWDVSNVECMDGMFVDCKNFIQDLGGWNTKKVKSAKSMFYRESEMPIEYLPPYFFGDDDDDAESYILDDFNVNVNKEEKNENEKNGENKFKIYLIYNQDFDMNVFTTNYDRIESLIKEMAEKTKTPIDRWDYKTLYEETEFEANFSGIDI